MKTPLLGLCWVLGIGSWAFAQFPIFIPCRVSSESFTLESASDGITVAGNFDGNFIADAVSIVDGELTFTHDLQYDRTIIGLGIDANDVTRRRVSDHRDEFVSVGASGLVVGRWDNDATFTGNNFQGLDHTVLSTAASWSNATRVRCGDLDGDGDQDIVALNGGGTRLWTMFDVAGTWVAGTPFDLPSAMSRFVILNHPTESYQVVACVNSSGCVAVDLVEDETIAHALPGGSYRELTVANVAGTEWIVAVTVPTNGGSSQSLVYATWTGSSLSQSLGGLDAPTITVGDANGDALPDLLLNSRVTGDLLVLLNRSPSTPMYLAGDLLSNWVLVSALGDGESDPQRNATLSVFDCDRDGDDDIVFTDRPNSDIRTYSSPLVPDWIDGPNGPEYQHGPDFVGYELLPEPYTEPGSSTPTGTTFRIVIEDTDEEMHLYSHLEVVIWAAESTSPLEIDPDAVFVTRPSLSSVEWSPNQYRVPIVLPEVDVENHYVLRIRGVYMEGGTLIESAGRSTMWKVDFEDLYTESTPISGGGITPRPGGGGSSGGATTP